MSTERPSRFEERSHGGDLVERLIPLAEHGPEVPADGADRVRAATRELWRREVARRRARRRLVWGGAGAAAAAVVLLAVGLARWQGAAQPEPVATVAVVEGTLVLHPAEGGRRVVTSTDDGTTIAPGTGMATDAGSRAALRLSGGQSLRLDRSTEVRLGPALTVALDRGAVYVDAGEEDVGTVEVHTAFGVARDVGTQFEVRVGDGELSVRVREGTVTLTRDDAVLQIAPGTGVSVRRAGGPRALAVPSYGDEWRWVQEVAPGFDIEGRTALAFLDWVSRETGLWVSFEDPEAERLAATTVLHGRLADRRPERVAELVLASCGLEASRDNGRLLVARTAGSP